MLKQNLTLLALLTLASLAVAQQQSRQNSRIENASTNASTDCAVTFSSGKGENQTQYCVSENGNIPQFSRAGQEFIQVGAITEGYGVCDKTATRIAYFDYGSADSGNWGTATFNSTASTATSTRITSDGNWQITNIITKVGASAGGPGLAKVTMKLKNLTNVDRRANVVRTVDIDFLQNGTIDLNNDFDFTFDTAFGLEPDFASGLSLVNNSSNLAHGAFAQNTAVGPDPCNLGTNLAPQPFVGDGSIFQIYDINVPKRATVTMNMTYKPI